MSKCVLTPYHRLQEKAGRKKQPGILSFVDGWQVRFIEALVWQDAVFDR